MNRLRLLLTAGGAVALAQLPAVANDIEFGGVTIPSQQTLSPATHDDIAFRPACSQLVPIQKDEWVFWTITLSDGEQRTLYTFPPIATDEAILYLDTYGLCKAGGVEVPLVYASQVPQRAVATVTTTPTMGGDVSTAGQAVQTVTPQQPESEAMPLWLVATGGVLLLGVIGFLFKATQGDNRKASPKQSQPKAKQNAAADLANLFGGDDNA